MAHISSIHFSQSLSRELSLTPTPHLTNINLILPSIKKIFSFFPPTVGQKSAWLTSEGETNEILSPK